MAGSREWVRVQDQRTVANSVQDILKRLARNIKANYAGVLRQRRRLLGRGKEQHNRLELQKRGGGARQVLCQRTMLANPAHHWQGQPH